MKRYWCRDPMDDLTRFDLTAADVRRMNPDKEILTQISLLDDSFVDPSEGPYVSHKLALLLGDYEQAGPTDRGMQNRGVAITKEDIDYYYPRERNLMGSLTKRCRHSFTNKFIGEKHGYSDDAKFPVDYDSWLWQKDESIKRSDRAWKLSVPSCRAAIFGQAGLCELLEIPLDVLVKIVIFNSMFDPWSTHALPDWKVRAGIMVWVCYSGGLMSAVMCMGVQILSGTSCGLHNPLLTATLAYNDPKGDVELQDLGKNRG